MNVKRIAAAYIRVSTEDQVEYSPDAQLVEIRKYAEKNNYLVPDSYVYMDEGISGKKTAKRDAFNRMIGVAKQKPKPFEAILLWKFSRFARNREDSVVYKSMLRKQLGIDVISISEPVGDDKMSVLIEALIEAMDEYYSINLAEEVRRGMTEKARRGGLQSTPAFGYTVSENKLVPIVEEAELVRSIFSRFVSGEGLFPIAKWLNEIGVTTHRGSRFENRTIEYILRNPVYIGKLRWNPAGRTRRDFTNENIIVSDAEHDAIISEETWDSAQRRMAQIKAQWKYHGRPTSEHRDWLSGLVRCSNCGNTLLFSKPHYWKCNGYTKGACKTSQHTPDERLKDMLIATMEHDSISKFPLEYSVIQNKPDQIDEQGVLKDQLEGIEKKISRLREAYLAGVESLAGYSEAKIALQEQRNNIEIQLNSLSQISTNSENNIVLRKNISNCVNLLKSKEASMQEKHRAVHDIIDFCTYSKENNSITIRYRFQC